jgi:hypothetical protein
MAENKKSFLLYCDLIHTIEKMPKENAGELFLHILKYVNDQNPTTDDLIVNLTFEPIKQQLKRDLKVYENICIRNKENGFKGGRPKKPKQPTGLLGNPKKPKKADTDNDTDNDTLLIPTVYEFLHYCKDIKEINYQSYEFSLKSKYETWVDDGWKDGNGKKIKNWKSKIKNTIPFLKPQQQQRVISNHDDGIL